MINIWIQHVETLGDFVKQERIKRDMKLTEFARFVNIPHQTISKWEKGEVGEGFGYPDFATLIKLSRATGASLTSIVLLLIPREERGGLSAEVRIIAEQIEQLPREARQFVQLTVSALVHHNVHNRSDNNQLLSGQQNKTTLDT